MQRYGKVARRCIANVRSQERSQLRSQSTKRPPGSCDPQSEILVSNSRVCGGWSSVESKDVIGVTPAVHHIGKRIEICLQSEKQEFQRGHSFADAKVFHDTQLSGNVDGTRKVD
jgi:hypothetical protein